MRGWDMQADHAADRRMLTLMKMYVSQTSPAVGELKKARMTVADLTSRLGVAKKAVGKCQALVERLWEQTEDAKRRRGALEKSVINSC